MRNYLKIWGMRVSWTSATFPGSTFFFVGFGGNEDHLSEVILDTREIIKSNTPNAQFTYDTPQIIWFKLNAENFVTLLNGISLGARELIWNGCQLPPVPNGFYVQWLAGVTDTKYAGDKSPRSTWSHGH